MGAHGEVGVATPGGADRQPPWLGPRPVGILRPAHVGRHRVGVLERLLPLARSDAGGGLAVTRLASHDRRAGAGAVGARGKPHHILTLRISIRHSAKESCDEQRGSSAHRGGACDDGLMRFRLCDGRANRLVRAVGSGRSRVVDDRVLHPADIHSARLSAKESCDELNREDCLLTKPKSRSFRSSAPPTLRSTR